MVSRKFYTSFMSDTEDYTYLISSKLLPFVVEVMLVDERTVQGRLKHILGSNALIVACALRDVKTDKEDILRNSGHSLGMQLLSSVTSIHWHWESYL